MKVGHTQPGSATEASAANAAAPKGQHDANAKENRFGKALDKKAAEKDLLETTTQGDPLADARLGLPSAFAPLPHSPSPLGIATVASTATITPPEITALQHEISHTLEVAGPNEVKIQFDSKTLDGLAVTLYREGGVLQVSMQVNSPEMARFLEAHAATLAQRLDQPERAAYIHIETRSPTARESGGNHQGDRQRDRDEDREQQAAASSDEGARP